MTILTTTSTKVNPRAIAAWMAREQRHQEFLAQVAAATVVSVDKPAQPQQPVCRWSFASENEQTAQQAIRDYVKRDRQRVINQPSV